MPDNLSDLVRRLPEMEAKAAHWAERFQAYLTWLEQRYERQRIDEGVRVGSYTSFQSVYGAITNKARTETEPELRQEIFDDLARLCLAYWEGNREQCALARQTMAQSDQLFEMFLPDYVNHLTAQAESLPIEQRVRLALAALSLYDMTYKPGLTPQWENDYPNVRTWMYPLRKVADDAKLNIVPFLREIAERSSEQPSRVAPDSPSLKAWFAEYIDGIGRESKPSPLPVTCPELSPLGAPALSLTSGVVITGTVTEDAPVVMYQFQVRKEQWLAAELKRTRGNLQPLLGLMNGHGMFLVKQQGEVETSIRGYQFQADGCYYLYVSCKGAGGEQTSGSYELVARGFS